MKNRDSFAAGMFATWGVLAAIAIAIAVAYFGLQEFGRQQTSKAAAAEAEEAAGIKKLAMPQLKLHGLTSISDDSGLTTDGGYTVLVGTGLDKERRLKRFMVHFTAAQFGSTKHLRIESINIDGREVYKAKD